MQQDNIPSGCLPFDLEKALAGHPVRTRDGRAVTDIARFLSIANSHQLLACVDGNLITLSLKGKHYLSDHDHGIDLFLKKPEPKKVKVWIPVVIAAGEGGKRSVPCAYEDEDYVRRNFKSGWQIIEAEIEVME